MECTTVRTAIHMDPEPGVIDNALILGSLAASDKETEDEAELSTVLNFRILDLEDLRLEFKNIVRVDHLWMMTKLTVLSLSNNLIEKIENLSALVNLEILNLSFNKIKKIENLEALVNLSQLGLFNNLIQTLEGLDALTNLEILSIGNNLIDGDDCIMYLRKFDKLRSVNLAGNPCTKLEDFRIRMTAYVPQLVYYEYQRITPNEKETAGNQYRYELRLIAEEDELVRAGLEKERLRKERLAFLAKSFVDGLEGDEVYEAFFAEDQDGESLMLIGEKVLELYDVLKEALASISKELFEMGQEQYYKREEHLMTYTVSVEKYKLISVEKGRRATEELLKKKVSILKEAASIVEEEDQSEVHIKFRIELIYKLMDKYEDISFHAWKDLMKSALQFYEQTEEARSYLGRLVGAITNSFIEKGQDCFTRMRDAEADFLEGMSDVCNRFLTTFHMRGANFNSLPDPLKPIMVGKESLMNSLGTSHDIHLRVIDETEDHVLNSCRSWLENLLDGMVKDENKRNRTLIYELNTVIDHHREKFRSEMEVLIDKLTERLEGKELITFIEKTLDIEQAEGHEAPPKVPESSDEQIQITPEKKQNECHERVVTFRPLISHKQRFRLMREREKPRYPKDMKEYLTGTIDDLKEM